MHATGWTPPAFPNPLINPELCNIGNAISATTNNNNNSDNSDSPSNRNQSGLLLCDPDKIFNEAGINRIANTLSNFTAKYKYSVNKTPPPSWGAKLSAPFQVDVDVDADVEYSRAIQPEIAIAIASKMDLSDILHDFAFYTFEDEDDMINDAAQYFASYLYNVWFGSNNDSVSVNFGVSVSESGQSSNMNTNTNSSRDMDEAREARAANGILIFISVGDRVSFISSGNGIVAVLPWWRLEKVVDGIQTDMRTGDYFDAIIRAVIDISEMLDEGPPTASERVLDFIGRFGVVLLFSMVTFCLALCGEYRDQKKKYENAELSSEMDDVEDTKARILQKAFRTESCPICLEDFDFVKEGGEPLEGSLSKTRVDSYGIPIVGSDGEPLKLLRCGHVFDHSCWRCWISSSGCVDPGICPVCRADIAKVQIDNGDDDSEAQSLTHLVLGQAGDRYGTFGEDQLLIDV